MKEETLEIQLKKVDHKRNEVLGPLSTFSLAALSISVVTGSIISTPSQDQLFHYIIWCVSVQYFHPLHLCSVPTPPIYPSTTYLFQDTVIRRGGDAPRRDFCRYIGQSRLARLGTTKVTVINSMLIGPLVCDPRYQIPPIHFIRSPSSGGGGVSDKSANELQLNG